jgi:hypothetical protein
MATVTGTSSNKQRRGMCPHLRVRFDCVSARPRSMLLKRAQLRKVALER